MNPMKPINNRQWIFFALAVLTMPMQAQQAEQDSLLSRTVIVEQEYNPVISDASKINRLPEVEEPTVPKRKIEYSITPIPVATFGVSTPMASFTRPDEQPDAQRGYVRLGYGNYGNLDARLSYLLNISKKDRLGILAGIDGMNGKLDFPEGKYKRHDYRSDIALGYLHRFDRLDMDIAGRWGLHNFGYAPSAPLAHQRFTSGDIHAGVSSTDSELPVCFNAETNLQLYSRAHEWTGNGSDQMAISEKRIRTQGNVWGTIDPKQQVGLSLQMDNFFYTKAYRSDYTALKLAPYYDYKADNWQLHAGVNADFSFNNGKTLQASPDVDARYIFNESYTVYAQAKGGRIFNDFRHLEAFCPYLMTLPGQAQPSNTYEQVNASIGIKASPYPGTHIHLYGGYQNLKDDLYQKKNGQGRIVAGAEDTNNFYAGASLSYTYKDWGGISIEGTYRNWDATDEALAFKPSFRLVADLYARPLDALLVGAGYTYQKYQKDFGQGKISDLHLRATYDIYKGLSAYLRIGNLLNRKYSHYWDYPVEGFNFVVGVSYQF